MPVSIPTYFALKFVRENNLTRRIYTLQNSFLSRYAIFGSLWIPLNYAINIYLIITFNLFYIYL